LWTGLDLAKLALDYILKDKVEAVNKFVLAAVLFGLVLGSASGHASNLEPKGGAVQSVAQDGQPVGIDLVIRKAGQTLDIGGGNIFAVLGGGLIAVSLLARRRGA
jgi:hypothetical protein